jgi:hypothetical protein
MSLKSTLERKFSWIAIENLPLYIVAASSLVFVFELLNPGFSNLLILDPARVLEGEVWRLLTFLFVPPPMHPLFMFFWLYLVYAFGMALEQEWGSFPFTTFYGLGALAHIASAFLILKGPVTNADLNLSLFLAFAVLFPNMELLLFFILPVKVKYLAILSWLWILWSFITQPWTVELATLVHLSNYFVFFGPAHLRWAQLRWEVYKNRQSFK